MSHVAGVNVKIKNLAALKRACDRMGTLEFVEGKKTYRWWGHHVGDYPVPDGYTKADLGKCDHVIRVKAGSSIDKQWKGKSYEIGVVKRKDGDGFDFLYDFYGGGKGIIEALRADLHKVKNNPSTAFDEVMQEYGLQVAEEECQQFIADGWQVERVKQDNGDIQLRVTK